MDQRLVRLVGTVGELVDQVREDFALQREVLGAEHGVPEVGNERKLRTPKGTAVWVADDRPWLAGACGGVKDKDRGGGEGWGAAEVKVPVEEVFGVGMLGFRRVGGRR